MSPADQFDIIPERDDRRTPRKKGSELRQKKTNTNNSSLLIFVIIASFGGFSYLYWDLQQSKTNNHSQEQRIKVIEQKLSVTDESLNQSGAVIQAKLKEQNGRIRTNFSEIRKLWNIAHQTNSKNINNNQQQIQTLKTESKLMSAQLAEAIKKVSNFSNALQTLSDLPAETVSNTALIQTLEQQLRNATDQLNKLKHQLSYAEKKIKGNSKQLGAINAFRLETNRRIIDLNQKTNLIKTRINTQKNNTTPHHHTDTTRVIQNIPKDSTPVFSEEIISKPIPNPK